MGIFKSIYRYIATLGGLIESNIDSSTDKMITTPSGIKATFQQTRDNWTKQYTEVRESVAELMIVLEKKRKKTEKLSEESEEIKIKMKGAVDKFKATGEKKYQDAFTECFDRDKKIVVEQETLNKEIEELHKKVEAYKEKLKEMQTRISELDANESEAIADIVSSQQIISLNDRLNNLSTKLDDKNLQAIEKRRQSLLTQSKLSSELSETELSGDIGKEILDAGMQSEASEVFAAMLAEQEQKDAPKSVEEERKREI